MSTILQTPKVKVSPLADTRILFLLIVAALVIALAAIFTGVPGSTVAGAFDQNAYMLHRQGEWISVPIRVSAAEAYQIFRRGEVVSPVSSADAYALFRTGEVMSPAEAHAKAYMLYRQGEWNSIPVPASDVGAYHLSERTLVDAHAGLTAYLLSERTLIDPQAGMAIYLNSERTSVPVRFTPYQRSEWFGE